ncbi:MAG: hypothetical protein MJ226_08375 [archaeon]|nr:hypothetical protein [archaeon]
MKGKFNCSYDEFPINCYLNQVIKSTMNLLVKADISRSRKKKLRNLLICFGEVDLPDIKSINCKILFEKNNQTYIMLVNIYVVNRLLHAEKICWS